MRRPDKLPDCVVAMMLKIAKTLADLDFPGLMELYMEGNQENGADLWPDEPESRRLFLAEQAFHQYLRECFFATEGALYAIWVVDGKYVSALRLEPYQDGLLLEALETAPDRRRRGYAKKLMTEVRNQFPNVRIYSHVGKRNVPSVRTHEACGFRKILDYAVYADGEVLPGSFTFLSQ